MTRKLEVLSISDEHILTNPMIHDSEVLCLRNNRHEKGHEFLVEIRSESGVKFEIQMNGVLNLFCTSLMPQNVLLHIEVYKAVDVSKMLKDLADSFYLESDSIQKLAKRILNGELLLVHFLPSVGVEIFSVCESISISK